MVGLARTWGSSAWYTFHVIALKMEREGNNCINKNNALSFFTLFRDYLIPCPICKEHFIEFTGNGQYKLEDNMSPDKIFVWTVAAHNNVNSMNRKKIYTVEEARSIYDSIKVSVTFIS